jgi:DNA-binding beta-propeller fold protein YncE
VIDTTSWKVTRTLEAGGTPEHMSLSADEKSLYVVNARAGTVSVVSVEAGKVVHEYKIGQDAHGLDLSEDGKSLFATSKKSGVVVKIDLLTKERKELALSPSPYHLEALPGTGKVYVSSSKSPLIWVIDAETFNKIEEIAISGEGHQMARSSVHTD